MQAGQDDAALPEPAQVNRELERRRIRFRCLTQPIDTSSPSGKFFFSMLAAFRSGILVSAILRICSLVSLKPMRLLTTQK